MCVATSTMEQIFVEKLTVISLFSKLHCPLFNSKVHKSFYTAAATGPYLEPCESNPHPGVPFLSSFSKTFSSLKNKQTNSMQKITS